MIQKITKTIVVGYNRFHPQTATVGWVDEHQQTDIEEFYTSDYIAVQQGDVITFGAAVTDQGWHLVAYNGEKEPYPKVTIHTGLAVVQRLDQTTSIMEYTVPIGVAYVRLVCAADYLHQYLVAINRPFRAEEYWAIVASSTAEILTDASFVSSENWTVVVNTHGCGTMTVGEQRVSFSPSTIVCVPPNVPFQKHSAEGFIDIQIQTTDFSPAKRWHTGVLTVQDDDSQSVEALAQLMLRVFWQVDGDNTLLNQLYATLEQIVLYRINEEASFHQQIKRMLNQMQNNFTDPDFALEQLFTREHYSQNHLRRLFKQEVGCSPLAYLLTLRVDYAKERMRQNQGRQVTIAQIGFMSGFRDPCYFSRIFKKRTGVSPAHYMKNQI